MLKRTDETPFGHGALRVEKMTLNIRGGEYCNKCESKYCPLVWYNSNRAEERAELASYVIKAGEI